MINEKMLSYGKAPSVIREIFEYGLNRSAEIGRENVFDYSLGNPSVPAPDVFVNAIADMNSHMDPVALHGYTSGPGDMKVRSSVAAYISENYGVCAKAADIYMTCGAAASLSITLNALIASPEEEVIVFAPFFPEYRVFTENAGGKLVVVPADEEHFLINFDALKASLNEHTKAVIVNSPNNPSGAVLTRECIERLCCMLKEAEEKYRTSIYLISDEPYRELVYEETTEVPYLPRYYDNTVVCYSFSKSLSVPGERIGYIFVPDTACEADDLFAAVCGAGRAMGYVCAPAMMQRVAAQCLGKTSDISVYRKNRDLLFGALTSYGFECVHPDGAFYLFMKAPGGDAKAFAMKARDYELLLVPSESFGCSGYVRLSYCVSTEMIERSLPAFEALAKACALHA